MVPWTHLILHPKRHLDRISRWVPNAMLYIVLSLGKITPKIASFPWDFVTPPKEDRATAIGNMHKNVVKIACVVREIWSRTDRQTHTQSETCSLQYFATAPAGEVINIIKTKHIYSVPKDKTISENIPLHITIARDMVSVSDVWVSKPSRDPQRSRSRTFGSRAHVRK